MIWGYRFSDIEGYLAGLGYRRVRVVEGVVIFRMNEAIFTIREPNQGGMPPETIVLDAFDAAGLPPPPQATDFVD